MNPMNENKQTYQIDSNNDNNQNNQNENADEQANNEENSQDPEALKKYITDAKGIIPKIIDTGKKSEKMGLDALKEAQEYHKEAEDLIQEQNTKAAEIPAVPQEEEPQNHQDKVPGLSSYIPRRHSCFLSNFFEEVPSKPNNPCGSGPSFRSC